MEVALTDHDKRQIKDPYIACTRQGLWFRMYCTVKA
jgi:hypothetical protein